MSNNELYQNAMNAIQKLYGDTSVEKEKALENLRGLVDEIELMIEALDD